MTRSVVLPFTDLLTNEHRLGRGPVFFARRIRSVANGTVRVFLAARRQIAGMRNHLESRSQVAFDKGLGSVGGYIHVLAS